MLNIAESVPSNPGNLIVVQLAAAPGVGSAHPEKFLVLTFLKQFSGNINEALRAT
jgi:hypothetical protein